MVDSAKITNNRTYNHIPAVTTPIQLKDNLQGRCVINPTEIVDGLKEMFNQRVMSDSINSFEIYGILQGTGILLGSLYLWSQTESPIKSSVLGLTSNLGFLTLLFGQVMGRCGNDLLLGLNDEKLLDWA